jgi:tetratricopeptide (TPR) repeat protein
MKLLATLRSLPAFCIAYCALVFTLASASAEPAAVDHAKALRENNERVKAVLRAIESAGQNKKYADITNNVDKLFQLLAIKEDTPDVVSPAGAHLAIAKAIVREPNLIMPDMARKHFAEALRLGAGNPDVLAETLLEKARWDYLLANDPPEKGVAAMRAALATPGLRPARRLDLTERYADWGFESGFDEEAEMRACAGGDPELLSEVLRRVIQRIGRAQRKGFSRLKYAYSREHVVELCDEGLALPTERHRATFIEEKAKALEDMERYREAEEIYLAQAATTDNRRRASWCQKLGDFYVRTAERYYERSDPATLRKAIAAYTNASVLSPSDQGPLRKIADAALLLRDYDLARDATERQIPLNKGVANGAMEAVLGRCDYLQGDYEGAARHYGAFPKELRREDCERYARALFACGRYDESAVQLERLLGMSPRTSKDSVSYYLERVKALQEKNGGKIGQTAPFP